MPRKNIKPLGGLPLIAWTIKAALESGVCTAVQVSTDDPAIAEVALTHGASVPALRPLELSTDTASSIDVAIHALNAYEAIHGKVDGLLLLQPTSPFRKPSSICRAVALFTANKGQNAVVSFCPASNHPAWCFREISEGVEPFLGWDAMGKRSQELEQAWMLNGSIYLISPDQLRTNKTFFNRKMIPLLMTSKKDSLDIDDEMDWLMAEFFLKILNT